MSAKKIQQVRKHLAQAVEGKGDDHPISMNAAARGIGISATAVSQFLAGKYPGDNARLAEKIVSWLRRQAEKQQYTEILEKTLDTSAVRRVLQTARICHIQREIGVATGPAGAGKTRGCKLYARKNPDVILIEVLPYYTARYVMSDIHRQVGFNGQGTVISMTNDVIDRMRDTGRLIIIDEAEHLPYKALELIRRLHDLAGIGILLVGMPQLISNLRGNHGQYQQLYSRIGLHSMIPEMNEQDTERLVASALPESNGVWKHFADETKNARSLSKLLKQSIQIAAASQTEVDAGVIKQAKQYIII